MTGALHHHRLEQLVSSIPGGSSDWIAAGDSDDALSWTVETVSNAGAHFMGATTYAQVAAH